MFKLNLKSFFLILFIPFLMGSDACRENYNFAAQSTITDDEDLVVNFAASSSVSNGETGRVSVNVTLSQVAEDDVSIPFTVTGTATADTDFEISESPLIITAGATSATISVTVLADQVDDDEETVIITLGTPTGATLGSRSVHTLTISEDGSQNPNLPTVSFEITEGEVEEDSELEVVFSIDEAIEEDLEVDFDLSGTATIDVDYEIDETTVLILAGETEGSIIITSLSDTEEDDQETVIVTIQDSADELYTVGDENVFTATLREPGLAERVVRVNPSDSEASLLGKEIIAGLLSLEENNTKSSNNSVGRSKNSNDQRCNWIGNSEKNCDEDDLEFLDSDRDGYSDDLELYLGSNPEDSQSIPPAPKSKLQARFVNVDTDLDGLSDQIELQIGTDPFNPDSDQDGNKDGLEDLSNADPRDALSVPLDQDGDGLSDDYEKQIAVNFGSIDSDFDGINDGMEIILGTNPWKIDSDQDGISDFQELQLGSDPTIKDWGF